MYILNFPNKKIYHLHIYAFTSTSILSASKNMLLKINTSSNRRLKVLRIINENLSVHTVVKSVICLRSPIMSYVIATQISHNRIYCFFMEFNRKGQRNEKYKYHM